MSVHGIVCVGVEMILPDLILPSRVNQRWQYSGMDSPEQCINKKYFREYPYEIDYQYNSRGFRDAEWPASSEELKDAVWCIGDSFTVGIGQPFDHIWPHVLSRRLQARTINISMDGASNDWIYRRAEQIQTEIAPKYMLVMWSYTHRREHTDICLDDESRRILSNHSTAQQDWWHWLHLVTKLRRYRNDIIESTIPEFCNPNGLDVPKICWESIKDPSWPRYPENLDEFDSLPDFILKELKEVHKCYILIRSSFLPSDSDMPPTEHIDTSSIIHVTKRLDWARDYHHFDILTSEWLVDQILQRMKTLDSSRNHVLPESEN